MWKSGIRSEGITARVAQSPHSRGSVGSAIPAWLDDTFDKAIRDDRQELLATALATELCSELIEGGAEDLHFYTLNRPELTRDVCHALGVTPKVELRDVA